MLCYHAYLSYLELVIARIPDHLAYDSGENQAAVAGQVLPGMGDFVSVDHEGAAPEHLVLSEGVEMHRVGTAQRIINRF